MQQRITVTTTVCCQSHHRHGLRRHRHHQPRQSLVAGRRSTLAAIPVPAGGGAFAIRVSVVVCSLFRLICSIGAW